jgi:hypothetical protein
MKSLCEKYDIPDDEIAESIKGIKNFYMILLKKFLRFLANFHPAASKT